MTLVPSVPASGESLTRNVIASVGGSIGCAAIGVSIDRIADCHRHGGVGQAGQRDNVAGFGFLNRHALDAAERQYLGDAAVSIVLPSRSSTFTLWFGFTEPELMRPVMMRAEIIVGFDDGAEQAERAFLDHRRLDVAQNQIEQRLHTVVVRAFQRGGHPALLGRTVQNREIELFVGGVEGCEQVEHFVDHLDRTRVRTVDFVDDDDGLEAHAQRLGHHEFGLRQRAFGGVNQHQSAVDHIQNALDLAAEIGMARRIDDVDARAFPFDRRGLGQNGDAALALEVVGIHRPLDLALVGAVDAGLLQQTVDQSGFAMVDVRDNGDVTKIHSPGFQKRGGGPHRTSLKGNPSSKSDRIAGTAIL